MTTNKASILTAIIAVSGTLGAAYISASQGMLFLPNKKLEKQVSELLEKQASELKAKLRNHSTKLEDFEWQWAGDNWLGSIMFNSLAKDDFGTKLDMRSFRVNPETKTAQIARLFWSDGDGIATVSNSGIHLQVPVMLTDEYRKVAGVGARQTIEADLQPVDAFAGRVKYWGDEKFTGDIILVRYKSDVRKW